LFIEPLFISHGGALMNRKTCFVLLALALPLLNACEPRENCAEGHDPLNTHQMRICADKKEYDFGVPISITFTVTNVSDEPLTLDGGDQPALDIDVWREHWSDGQELTPELTRVTLEPGESRTINWVWPTSQTDFRLLINSFPPEGGRLTVRPLGTVIPLPGASPRAVWVDAYYRKPR
jgi:hypothetical protein